MRGRPFIYEQQYIERDTPSPGQAASARADASWHRIADRSPDSRSSSIRAFPKNSGGSAVSSRLQWRGRSGFSPDSRTSATYMVLCYDTTNIFILNNTLLVHTVSRWEMAAGTRPGRPGGRGEAFDKYPPSAYSGSSVVTSAPPSATTRHKPEDGVPTTARNECAREGARTEVDDVREYG